jgi:membrane-associated PAP2 superfamily phosphatase
LVQVAHESRTRFYVTHAVLPLLAAAILAVVFDHTQLDRWTLDPFYDPVAKKFPLWRDNELFDFVFRELTKYMIGAFALLVVMGLAASMKRPSFVPWRRSMIYVLLCLILGPAVVALWKYTSCHHCPWYLDIYGGDKQQASLFGCPPPSSSPGHCFPSGHASGGFALFGMYFVHRIRSPERARRWFAIAFACGSIMGVSRMMQGAHFLSHTIASGFVCWFVCLIVYELFLHKQDEERWSPRPA